MSNKAEIPAETPLYYASKLVASALETLKSSSADASALKQLELAHSLLTKLDPYLDAQSTYPEYLAPLLKATAEHDWDGAYARGDITIKLQPHWSAGPYEGAWIGQFVKSVQAKRVLEVGMFTGTTTLAIAENLPKSPDAHVTTLELFDYLETFVRPHFDKAGHGKDRITVLTGKASDRIAQLGPDSPDADDVPKAAKGPYGQYRDRKWMAKDPANPRCDRVLTIHTHTQTSSSSTQTRRATRRTTTRSSTAGC